MKRLLARATGIRGQLIVWYLGILAVLLLALGIFQSIILGNSLRTSLAGSMRQAARAELAVLGPCYIRSAADLRGNAQGLAQLLGSREMAVKIVTRSGITLADHGSGTPGATHPLRLSQATIHNLVSSTSIGPHLPTSTLATARCNRQAHIVPISPAHRFHSGPSGRHTLTAGNDLLLAVPLGPWPHVVGYAILGRSLSDTDATVHQVDVIFALGAVLALALAALAALPTINRALHPLRRVAATAEAIAAGDLDERANLAHSGDEIGRLGVAFDTMVDRLQSALSSATESEERMRQFLADASHELRTPVTVLRGASQVLLRGAGSDRPEVRAGLGDMHEEAVRLSRLVDDLLTLSRIDVGPNPTPQAVHLDTFLHDFVDRYGRAWPARSIQVDGALDGATAYIEAEALRRIVTNLVDNAARYSRPDGEITLGGGNAGAMVSLSVSDLGPGMSAEEADRVFDRFYRASKSRSRRDGGTGLGLAIVQGLVEGSGGHIHIDTAPDRGTTVTVHLPSATT